jgi:hypothetical protein
MTELSIQSNQLGRPNSKSTVSRDTFDIIRANNGMYSATEIYDALEQKGYIRSSISAVLCTLLKADVIFKTSNNKVGTLHKTYPKFKNPYITSPSNVSELSVETPIKNNHNVLVTYKTPKKIMESTVVLPTIVPPLTVDTIQETVEPVTPTVQETVEETEETVTSQSVDQKVNKNFWTNKDSAWKPEQIADNLNLVQAHALYSYMNQYFGNNKSKISA